MWTCWRSSFGFVILPNSSCCFLKDNSKLRGYSAFCRIHRGNSFLDSGKCCSRGERHLAKLFLKAVGKGFGIPKRMDFPYSGTLRPGQKSPTRKVPADIPKPNYAKTGLPPLNSRAPWDIEVHSDEDLAMMRISCQVAREVLDIAAQFIRPGVTTDEIDDVVHQETLKRGAYPSPLNYYNFPKSCCTSVNEIICHGIPDSTVLREGDIINVDVTCFVNGFHGDCSATLLVGNVDEEGKRLVRTTYDCLYKAIKICKPGVSYNKIGEIIEDHATSQGFSVVRNFCGHGIGRVFHTSPNVLHHRNRERNGVMQVGHIFTIEPMINEGTFKSITWPDKWTTATADGKRSAQFEHTIAITSSGVEVLTRRTEHSPRYFWERNLDKVEF
ncbi:Methionine aminopeptidase 1A [Galdieria sulphuraria]|uniref:Methionine aminopeptidase n=1 Tax=Galdieria sulphuraria TaxID=130081 RepID=M2Y5N9_GALSU|nr:methionyl aminopeptidase [Galdieria sulphuraria]EME31278.1 methionyl aminopeptidase [Galdieria sulphuraria]GJD07705.1 Methionine aminopeptidase 1A [Galdieria sulphuraria]|eukprot:XP_005707798.1 methionyl aminopeptidase [Galdieria sulphuraria]